MKTKQRDNVDHHPNTLDGLSGEAIITNASHL